MVIVAAVDNSNRADEVIRQAKTLAEAFDDTIHVVHVLTRSEFVNLGRTQAEEGDSVDMETIKNVAATIAKDAATSIEGSFEAVGLMGSPAEKVVDYAAKQEARYITIAGRKRSPAGKVIFGSVSQSILLNAECPVVLSTKQ